MLNRARAFALVLVSAAFVSACGPKVDLKMAVEVVSDPGAATVTFKGKDVGSTPAALQVNTFDELMSIAARREGAPVSEKRVRILAPDKAQLVFRFGADASAVAKKLGLTQVLVFDYSEKVSFDSGKSELKPDGLPILSKQAEILKGYFPNVDVYVCGHTDSTGGDDLNLKLSLDRAKVVSDFLVARGVPKERLKVQGFGKEYPNDSNETPVGRGNNRRTELILPQ
ncbi:MAG TPA: OmpA family protein [Thermoanaerobaculia bacterium]|nr:OmpA family protein [Thermoanaerobaculia bacterium]